MNFQSIKKYCILHPKIKLKRIFTIKNHPVFIGTTSLPKHKHLKLDMHLAVCRCGLLQLQNLVDPKILYSKYHSEALGKVWQSHNIKFLNFLKKYLGNNVLEIGGTKEKHYHKTIKMKNLKEWFFIDPSIKNKDALNLKKKYKKKVKFFKTLFDSFSNKINFTPDTLVMSHSLEHFFYPVELLKKLFLDYSSINKVIISIPNIEKYIDNKQTNSLNFEHTFFINKNVIKEILSKVGFKINKVENFNTHSIFVYASKQKIKKKNFNYSKSSKKYLEMINFYKKRISLINSNLKKNKKKYFIFGAHIFSQLLITLGLKEKNIKYVLDNSKLKTNQRLYGSNLLVKRPGIIKGLNNPTVIAFVGAYQNEINEQLIKINNSVKIIQ